MATIRDVAKLAGIAPSTVSRVVTGSSRISVETQERVRSAVRKLDYRPNAIARSLARRSAQTIGFLISRPAEQALANPFFPEVIRGVGTVLHDRGFYLLLATSNTAAEEEAVALRYWWRTGYDRRRGPANWLPAGPEPGRHCGQTRLGARGGIHQGGRVSGYG